MECNKDEAARSKAISEAKFLQHDLAGARKFALKAKQLYPELEGLLQLISVLEVHSTAEEKLQGGEKDWYGILQVDPTADESTIRKQYRKLALLLHPDKNKSVGAEGAFKHISEAWGVLSDKAKKAVHDMRRNSKSSQSSKVARCKEPSSARNGSQNSRTSKPQPQSQSQAQAQAQTQTQVAPPPPTDASTFWTSCPSCKMQFEYPRIYQRHHLCCAICYKPFLAIEVPFVSGITLWPLQDHQGFKMDGGGPYHHTNGIVNGTKSSTFGHSAFPWPPNGNTGKKKRGQSEFKAKAAANSKEAFERLIAKSKGVIEQKLSSAKPLASERKLTGDIKTAFGCTAAQQFVVSEQWTAAGQNASSGRVTPAKVFPPSNGSGEGKENTVTQGNIDADKVGSPGPAISKLATRTSPRGKRVNPTGFDHEVHDGVLPTKKTRADAQASADEQNEQDSKTFKLEKTVNTLEGEQEGGAREIHFLKPHANPPNAPIERNSYNTSLPTSRIGEAELDTMPVNADGMNVPDSDFYDFDKDRTEHHFLAGQIWAVYDDDDGMPRYYARISKVISQQPFKIQMSWLEARAPSSETIAWLDAGFSYTCGDYKLGKTTTNEYVNIFSHVVTYEKGQRGGFKIYPRKGEIWALYKDLSNLKTKDAKKGYEMMEVISDFEEELGVQVSMLAKVEGFKALFCRQPGAQYEQWISPKELRRFSHQVPSHRLKMEQALGMCEGCWELDPASTPLDLMTEKPV